MTANAGDFPKFTGMNYKPQFVTPDAVGKGVVLDFSKVVCVNAVTNDANDFIVLPLLANVPDGHEFKVFCNAGTNFEIRTPALSNNKINNVDCDGGANEYLATDTEIIIFQKIDGTIGWMAQAYSQIGAVVAAVVPHAN